MSLDPQGGPALATDDGETLTGNFESVSLVLGDADQGPGVLFVTNRRIVWVGGSNGSAEPSSHGVHFTDIMMHALASPSEDFAKHSIYMQLDGAQAGDDEDGNDAGPPEVRLVPAEPSQMDAIFQALCEGALANPDPDAEEDEGDFFYDEDEVANGAAANGADGHSALADRLDAVLHVPPQFQAAPEEGQFEDADEDEGDDHDGATPDCACCRQR